VTQVQVHAGRARILAREGELVEAERLARATMEEADATDYIQLFTRSRQALADVLRLTGRMEQAIEVLEEAAATEERRGNAPFAATLRRTPQRWAST
jgi:hypothetical protein